MNRRIFLGSCLAAPLGACFPTSAGSEQNVVPKFNKREFDNRRVLLAPYSLAQVENRYLPLPEIELRDLNRPNDDPAEQSLELFYSAGVSEARATTREMHASYQIVELAPSSWAAYFTPPARFKIAKMSGGKETYLVPEPAALAALGASADYVLILGNIRFTAGADMSTHFGQTGTYQTGVDMMRCYFNYLVWDYARERAIVEGTMIGEKHPTGSITRELFESLARQVSREIFSNPPFVNA